MNAGLMTVFACIAIILLIISLKLQAAKRAEYIRNYPLPKGLFEKLQKRRPELSLKDCQLVNLGLRQFFLAYLQGGRQFVAMPSQVVDELWHEFILYTRQYDRFCKRAFGGFFHHTPAVVLKSSRQNNTGLRRCWWHACKQELINPKKPTRLPLLFALDAKLNIADGFRYVPDCSGVYRDSEETRSGSPAHCGGDFSDTSIDGATDGFDSFGSTDSNGDSGCGGGCGGD